MVLVAFVEFSYLRACGSFSIKKKVKVGSNVCLAKGYVVDDVYAPILGGVIPLCTLKEWLSYSWADVMD